MKGGTRPVAGRPPTTDRSPGRGGVAVRVNLSAAEHAAYVLAAHPQTVAAWLRMLAENATHPTTRTTP